MSANGESTHEGRFLARGDFTASTRLLWISTLAFAETIPADNTLGVLAIFVPVIGALIIGLMARFGSERIRGHGIPEALEAILIGRSRMSPRVAVLKPLSSAVDPLERVSVDEVMATDVVTIPAGIPVRQALGEYFLGAAGLKHQAYPVVDGNGNLLGVVTRGNLLEDWVAVGLGRPEHGPGEAIIVYDLIHRDPITVFPSETCRPAAERMASAGVGRLPVVSPDEPSKVIGMITRSDLLKPRARSVEEEEQRERFFGPGAAAKNKSA